MRVVVTGGVALLPGLRETAARTLRLPVRVAQPEKLTGMADALRSPSFSTSVGLLRLGLALDHEEQQRSGVSGRKNGSSGFNLLRGLGGLFGRFLPSEENN